MLDSLHHFVLIAELGTFTEAAQRAHITQPGLSASIRRLEDALGARLLDRLPRGAAPTAAGRALLPRARAALAAVEDGRRAVSEVLGLEAGEVTVGGGAVACTYLLPPILAEFREAHPGVTLRLRETLTPRVAAAVDSGRLDLGVTVGQPEDDRAERLGEDPLVFVAAPLAAEAFWDGERLIPGTPLVTFPEGASLRAEVDRALPDAEIVTELSSISAAKGMVRAGIGVTLLSRAAVAVDLELGRVVALPDPRTPPPRTLVLRHRGLDRLSPAARALRDRVLESASGDAGI